MILTLPLDVGDQPDALDRLVGDERPGDAGPAARHGHRGRLLGREPELLGHRADQLEGRRPGGQQEGREKSAAEIMLQ